MSDLEERIRAAHTHLDDLRAQSVSGERERGRIREEAQRLGVEVGDDPENALTEALRAAEDALSKADETLVREVGALEAAITRVEQGGVTW